MPNNFLGALLLAAKKRWKYNCPALLVKNAKLYDRVRGVNIFFHSLRDKFMTIAQA